MTKAELPEAAEIHEKLKAELESPVLLISAVTGQNLNQLIHAIVACLNESPDDQATG